MHVKRAVETRDGKSALILYIPSDEYGVIEPQALGDALANLIGQTPRAMPAAEVARVLKSVAEQYDIPLQEV